MTEGESEIGSYYSSADLVGFALCLAYTFRISSIACTLVVLVCKISMLLC